MPSYVHVSGAKEHKVRPFLKLLPQSVGSAHCPESFVFQLGATSLPPPRQSKWSTLVTNGSLRSFMPARLNPGSIQNPRWVHVNQMQEPMAIEGDSSNKTMLRHTQPSCHGALGSRGSRPSRHSCEQHALLQRRLGDWLHWPKLPMSKEKHAAGQ